MGQAANGHPCMTQAIHHEGHEAAMDTEDGDRSDRWPARLEGWTELYWGVGSAGGGLSTFQSEEKKTIQTTEERKEPSAHSVPGTVP